MKFATYWAREYAEKGSNWSCWRWSDVSEEDARQQAREAAQRLAARMARGEPPVQYPYGKGERPMREEVLEELPGAAITRNGYGCTVLNTERLMFVDIDFEQPVRPQDAPPSGFFGSLFGGKKEAPEPAGPHPEEAQRIAVLRRWITTHDGTGARVYRTAAGLRYLVTHAPLDPDGEAITILEQLGSDPLYIQLCRAQQCFRARLSPKPWRIDHYAAANNWPARPVSRQWLKGYEKNAEGYATCAFVEQLGHAEVHPDLQGLVQRHDADCRVNAGLPLA